MTGGTPSGAVFARVLIEQKRAGISGGLYHQTQIHLAYNSNRIEGSRLSEDQTRYIFETKSIVGDALVDDVVETSNHFRAFDDVLDHAGQPISAETMKGYHTTLKGGTAQSRVEWFAVGDWKRRGNEVGGRSTAPPGYVDTAITSLLENTPADMAFKDIVDFHVEFERIHPFQDGNGRVGRLIMFEQCLANGHVPFVVPSERAPVYFRGLAEYDENPGILLDAFWDAQEAYRSRYARFVPAG